MSDVEQAKARLREMLAERDVELDKALLENAALKAKVKDLTRERAIERGLMNKYIRRLHETEATVRALRGEP